jgi:hypothetical protein
MVPQPREVIAQMKGVVRETILETAIPSLHGLSADTTFGNCPTHRIACQKKQEDYLPHFPKIPTSRRDALWQHRARRVTLGAVETENGNWVQGSVRIGFTSVATVTPNNRMVATGAHPGAVQLWIFTKCVNMLQKGKNVRKNDGHAWSP